MTALLSAPMSGWARSSGNPWASEKLAIPKTRASRSLMAWSGTCVRQDHANPAAKILDPSDAEVFQRPLDIAHEPLLEIFPVAAFEGEFVVVDDGACVMKGLSIKVDAKEIHADSFACNGDPAQPRSTRSRFVQRFPLAVEVLKSPGDLD